MDNAQFAQGLRELADLYDRHPEMLRPWSDEIHLHLAATKATLPATLRALADGGRAEKVAPEGDGHFFRVRRELPSGVIVEAWTDRSNVCTRVRKMALVDTWECPDSILDTEATA